MPTRVAHGGAGVRQQLVGRAGGEHEEADLVGRRGRRPSAHRRRRRRPATRWSRSPTTQRRSTMPGPGADPLVGGVEHRLEVGVGDDALAARRCPSPVTASQLADRSRDAQPGDRLALADPLAVVGEQAGEHTGERGGDRGGPARADDPAERRCRRAPGAGRAGSTSSSASTTNRPVTGASTMRSRTCSASPPIRPGPPASRSSRDRMATSGMVRLAIAVSVPAGASSTSSVTPSSPARTRCDLAPAHRLDEVAGEQRPASRRRRCGPRPRCCRRSAPTVAGRSSTPSIGRQCLDGRRQQRRVERPADGERHRLAHAELAGGLDGGVEALGRAADHDLAGRVVVGDPAVVGRGARTPRRPARGWRRAGRPGGRGGRRRGPAGVGPGHGEGDALGRGRRRRRRSAP